MVLKHVERPCRRVLRRSASDESHLHAHMDCCSAGYPFTRGVIASLIHMAECDIRPRRATCGRMVRRSASVKIICTQRVPQQRDSLSNDSTIISFTWLDFVPGRLQNMLRPYGKMVPQRAVNVICTLLMLHASTVTHTQGRLLATGLCSNGPSTSLTVWKSDRGQ
jgi:hypothetical protein